jgi:hypothetical protein
MAGEQAQRGREEGRRHLIWLRVANSRRMRVSWSTSVEAGEGATTDAMAERRRRRTEEAKRRNEAQARRAEQRASDSKRRDEERTQCAHALRALLAPRSLHPPQRRKRMDDCG